jgi:hypothetical protein
VCLELQVAARDAEIERLTRECNETEECLAAILNELDLLFQDKDEPMAAYQERCIAALRAADEGKVLPLLRQGYCVVRLRRTGGRR